MTSNDAAIAQAIARAEQEHADAEMARRSTDNHLPIVQGRRMPNNHFPPATSSSPSPHQLPPPSLLSGFATRRPPPTHMCIVPCIMGRGTCVEMMIDTGAQTSVISSSLANELSLTIDRSHQGVAVGVGRAKVVGAVRNVVCTLGHVEFPLDFIVLDIPDKMLLLGLDLMRRYKCIVDLERDRLIFGGSGGVEVNMLPADEQHVEALRNQLGCPMM